MKDFIRSVLVADPSERPSIATLKNHPIFKGIDFNGLPDIDAPTLPRAIFSVPPPKGTAWDFCSGCLPAFCFAEDTRPQKTSMTLDDDEYFELLGGHD